MNKSDREIELKFELDPAELSRVAKTAHLEGFSVSRPLGKSLRSIYFDTPDQKLREAKISLRLRQSNEKWVQTVKLGTGVSGGLSSPVEDEQPVAGPALDFSAIRNRDVHQALVDMRADSTLVACFETRIFRTTRELVRTNDQAQVELAFDTGHVLAGDDRLVFAELEMELKSGSALVLHDAARQLLADVPFRLSPCSKAERGYRFANGETQMTATRPSHRFPDDQRLANEHRFNDIFQGLTGAGR